MASNDDGEPLRRRRRDPWWALSRFTPARIAPGRAGGSLPTEALLDFRLAHGRARDAVKLDLRTEIVLEQLRQAGLETLQLATAVRDRAEYLMRPDLGRTLSEGSLALLEQRRSTWGARDLVIIVSDGLSAPAAERHAVPTVSRLVGLLGAAGWTVCPVLLVPWARVKLQDQIGELLGVRHSLVLLGERPGLGSPDSLGAYFTFMPCRTRTDAERNCVSNIRDQGLPPLEAAQKLALWLLESARLGTSGFALKEPAPRGEPPSITA